MSSASHDFKELSRIFEILKKYSNEDGYVCAGLSVFTGEMNVGRRSRITDPTVRLCINTLVELECVKEYSMLAWGATLSGPPVGIPRSLYKLLVDEFNEEIFARLEPKPRCVWSLAAENARLRAKIEEYERNS